MSEKLCGAHAVGGPCVLPRGHNMGNLDIPQNHKAAAPPSPPEPAEALLLFAKHTIERLMEQEADQRDCQSCLDKITAHLASQSPRPGYRLVAEEPTPEMLAAGTEAAVKSVWQCDDAVKLGEARRELTRTIYKAMLSASPK